MSYHNTGRNLTQMKAGNGRATYSQGTNNGSKGSYQPTTQEIYANGAVMSNPKTAQMNDTALDIVLKRLHGA